MNEIIPREMYELLYSLGLDNFCAGQSVEGYGYILPEITVTPFKSRNNETFYDVGYSSIVVGEQSRPEAIPEDEFGIIVLLNSKGAKVPGGAMGHSAVLIGNERTGWVYISKDGYGKGAGPFYSESKYIVKQFRSFAQFKASAHNHELQNGYAHSDVYGNEIDSLDYRIKKEKVDGIFLEWPIERYDKALFVPTDSVSNIKAIVAAIKAAKRNYAMVFDDCSEITTDALRAAGKNDGEHTSHDLTDPSRSFFEIVKQSPKAKHQKIREHNPGTKKIE